jgi:hypothetical protein
MIWGQSRAVHDGIYCGLAHWVQTSRGFEHQTKESQIGESVHQAMTSVRRAGSHGSIFLVQVRQNAKGSGIFRSLVEQHWSHIKQCKEPRPPF